MNELESLIQIWEKKLNDAYKHERHRNYTETSYWCQQYKLLATDALVILKQFRASNAKFNS